MKKIVNPSIKVIGIVGPIGSGKDLAAEYIAKKYMCNVIAYRDIVKEETEKEGLETNRENMQMIATKRRAEVGKDFFAKIVAKRAQNLAEKGGKIILKEIRTDFDAFLVKEIFGRSMIILAFDSNEKIRAQRIISRGRKGDPTSFEEFKKQDKREIELGHYYWMDKANETIKNNGSIEELYKKIDKIMDKLNPKKTDVPRHQSLAKSTHKGEIKMKLIIIGPAGSGKGTQAKFISENYKIPHISTGDLIREEIASASLFGKKLEQIINKGTLVSDEDVLKLLKQRLDKSKSGFILDGYPRNLNQAKTLDKIAGIDTVLFLNVKDDEVVRRLSTRWQCKKCGEIYNTEVKKEKVKGKCNKCGNSLYQRDDDKPEAIRKRLEIFHKDTIPIIGFYKKKGILKEIQQKERPDQVFAEVKKLLD